MHSLPVATDYCGEAFQGSLDNYADALGPRTSVLILGDGRTNRMDPNLPAVQSIVDRAKRTYWLNPEPSRSWSTGTPRPTCTRSA
ncbi:VWA domain-containing protein [Nocardia asiatica]|uniref:VWA domain-containing protein n=1 Tax=Nocardia asiatica TaxID=209252 RepID=UPI001FE133DF|nr:VWA domain-containing protein [Nocardia asiatica]